MTQIRVSEATRTALNKLKLVPSETHGSVVDRLIAQCSNKPKYDDAFKDFVKDVMKSHYPKKDIMAVQECHVGLQIFCDKSNIILLTHNELKIWKALADEGLEPSKESYSLLEYDILKTMDAKLE